jgi:hypothetical protein
MHSKRFDWILSLFTAHGSIKATITSSNTPLTSQQTQSSAASIGRVLFRVSSLA